jgi:hypothetical protein
MKNALRFISIIVILTFISCKKDSEIIIPKPNTLIGEWSWIVSYGGFTGSEVQTPASTNKSRKISFKLNGSFIMIENSDTVQNTTYFTRSEESILNHNIYNFVTVNYKYQITGTDSVIILPMRYMVLGMQDSLLINEDVFDGYHHNYLRLK